MKKLSQLFVYCIVLVFLFSAGLADFTSSYAEENQQGPTKSGIKAKIKAAKEKRVAQWKSLNPEQQEYLKEEAKARAKTAKMNGQEYWNSMSEEEQQAAIERSKEGLEKGRKRWQSLPD